MLSKVSDSVKMESASAKIEMLRGEENWLQWRFVMRTLLKEDDDLINVCEGNLCHLYVAKKLPVDFNEAMRSEKKEIMWLKKIFLECKIEIFKYTLCVDNTSVVKLIKNPEFHQRSKHIDIRYHFLRDLYNRGEIDVTYVTSEEQLADICTKALPKPRFKYLRQKLGLKNKKDVKR